MILQLVTGIVFGLVSWLIFFLLAKWRVKTWREKQGASGSPPPSMVWTWYQRVVPPFVVFAMTWFFVWSIIDGRWGGVGAMGTLGVLLAVSLQGRLFERDL